MNANRPAIPKIQPGCGRIVLSANGAVSAMFSELSATYPLKFLSPNLGTGNVAVVYVLSYGGGLVGGDQVSLYVEVDNGTNLVMLSQGHTKVFASRHRISPAHPPAPDARRSTNSSTSNSSSSSIGPRDPRSSSVATRTLVTSQTMEFIVRGALFLLPDPVTCFGSASYDQIQRFYLSEGASIAILDWVTSGRKLMGEEWAFARYNSVNEVWVGGKRLVKDVTLLQAEPEPEAKAGQGAARTLRERLAPYACYATLILHGPLVQNLIKKLKSEYSQISLFRQSAPESLIWSLSHVDGLGIIVRIAGKEVEMVKEWLKCRLGAMEEVVGVEVLQKFLP